jgi:hypothetical protein
MEVDSMTVMVPYHEVNFIFSHPDADGGDWNHSEYACYEEFSDFLLLKAEGIEAVGSYEMTVTHEAFSLDVYVSTVEEALTLVRGAIASWNAAFDPFRYHWRAYWLRNGQDPDVIPGDDDDDADGTGVGGSIRNDQRTG